MNMFIYYLPFYTLIPSYIIFFFSLMLSCRYIAGILKSGNTTAMTTAGAQNLAKAGGDMQTLVTDSAGWMKIVAIVSSLLLILFWWFCTPVEKLATMTSTFLIQSTVSFILFIVNRLAGSALLSRIKGDPMFQKFFSESKRVSRILFAVTILFLVIYWFLSC